MNKAKGRVILQGIYWLFTSLTKSLKKEAKDPVAGCKLAKFSDFLVMLSTLQIHSHRTGG